MEEPSSRQAPTLRRSRRRPLIPSSSFIRAMRSRFGLLNDQKPPPSSGSAQIPQIPSFRPRRSSHLSSGARSPSFLKVFPTVPSSPAKPSPPTDPPTRHHPSHTSLKHHVPIRRLPPELLICIFSFTATLDSSFPTTASHVCGLWRELVLQTPTLWRLLVLDDRTNICTRHLSRARGCTIDISLAPAPFGSKRQRSRALAEWTHMTVQRALHPSLAYIKRWRSLSLRFDKPSPFLWNAALSPLCLSGTYAPALEKLELIYPGNDDSKHFALFSGYAPRLQHAALWGVRLVWDHGLFGNLIYLDYAHPSFTAGPLALVEILEMLRISSRLVQLRLSFLPLRDDIPPVTDVSLTNTIRPVVLPCLRLLQVSVLNHGPSEELLGIAACIVAPELHTLRLCDRTRSTRPFPMDIASWAGLRATRILSVEYGWACRRHVLSAVYSMRSLSHVVVVGQSGSTVQLEVPSGKAQHARTWLNHQGIRWTK